MDAFVDGWTPPCYLTHEVSTKPVNSIYTLRIPGPSPALIASPQAVVMKGFRRSLVRIPAPRLPETLY